MAERQMWSAAAVAVLATAVLASCSGPVPEDSSAPDDPAVGATAVGSTPPTSVPEPSGPPAETCAALADYLANGGTSHDDVYDPSADNLEIFGVKGRKFLLTPEDAECIAGSPAVSRRVRDAVQASGAGWSGPNTSELLQAAVEAGVRISVLSHCGVRSLTVKGRLWLADPPLGGHNPPPGWDENQTPGHFIQDGRRGQFYGDQGQRASFLLAPAGAKDPNLGCE